MNKYVAIFCIPSAAIEQWMTTVDEATRKEQSDKMMQDWQVWMDAHAANILDKGLPLGKTKQIMKEGVTDVKNDLNWYLVVQAESHDAAAQMFVGHPHLEIPTAYVQVMDANRAGM